MNTSTCQQTLDKTDNKEGSIIIVRHGIRIDWVDPEWSSTSSNQQGKNTNIYNKHMYYLFLSLRNF
jgi:hypothetical protein